jgi:hypothetical protein
MTQRLGWLATAGIAVVVLVGACIPTGARVPTRSPASADPSTSIPTFFIYQVRPGDTLTSIARAHGTTGRSIAFWNRARYPSLDPDSSTYSPNRIEVGWELLIIPDVELDPEELPEPSG